MRSSSTFFIRFRYFLDIFHIFRGCRIHSSYFLTYVKVSMLKVNSRFFIRFRYILNMFPIFRRLQDTFQLYPHVRTQQLIQVKVSMEREFSKFFIRFRYFCYLLPIFQRLQDICQLSPHICTQLLTQVKVNSKVFHKISVLFGYIPYVLEVISYISAISAHTHSVVEICKSQ